MRAVDALAFDWRIDELATTVCKADPRTKAQRRADALASLSAGAAAMRFACGSPDCPAANAEAGIGEVVIHVLADAATVDGTSADPGYVPGFGGLSAQAVRQLAPRRKCVPSLNPKTAGRSRATGLRPPWLTSFDAAI